MMLLQGYASDLRCAFFCGEQRLDELIVQCGKEDVSAENIHDRVVQDVVSFVGDAPQADDLTVVVLKVL